LSPLPLFLAQLLAQLDIPSCYDLATIIRGRGKTRGMNAHSAGAAEKQFLL
jgi:hypothetical protein